jgi:hypothetical protein
MISYIFRTTDGADVIDQTETAAPDHQRDSERGEFVPSHSAPGTDNASGHRFGKWTPSHRERMQKGNDGGWIYTPLPETLRPARASGFSGEEKRK